MKHLKLFENYVGVSSRKPTFKDDIRAFCSRNIYGDFKINDDFSIDVKGNVRYEDRKENGEIPYKFNRVDGNFQCDRSGLKSLKNSPNYISGNFYCHHNYLTTLLDGPKNVIGKYFCQNNLLKDMYGFPKFFENYLYTIPENYINQILNLVSKEKTVRFVKILNEYQVIRNQDTVIESRLKDALSEIGENLSSLDFISYDFKNYKLI